MLNVFIKNANIDLGQSSGKIDVFEIIKYHVTHIQLGEDIS